MCARNHATNRTLSYPKEEEENRGEEEPDGVDQQHFSQRHPHFLSDIICLEGLPR